VPEHSCWIENVGHGETPRLDARRRGRRNAELFR
jgi:hypothetical protein